MCACVVYSVVNMMNIILNICIILNITNSIKIEVYSGTKLVPEAIVVPFSIVVDLSRMHVVVRCAIMCMATPKSSLFMLENDEEVLVARKKTNKSSRTIISRSSKTLRKFVL